jgi:flagellar basal body-associated protein FliL
MSSRKTGKKKGGKCCIFGCIILALIPLLFIAAVIGLFMWFGAQVQPYLTDTAMDIPSVTLEASEQEQLMQRVQEFDAATRTGQPATLELTGEELNAYLHAQDDYQTADAEIFFRIRDNTLKMLFSGKLSDSDGPQYLNFIATLEAAENPASFFKFDLTGLSFPDNTELTDEQKVRARNAFSDVLRLIGESIAQDTQGGIMIADDRLIIVSGQEPVDPATQAPEQQQETPAEPEPAGATP